MAWATRDPMTYRFVFPEQKLGTQRSATEPAPAKGDTGHPANKRPEGQKAGTARRARKERHKATGKYTKGERANPGAYLGSRPGGQFSNASPEDSREGRGPRT
jgi:hypothetical protein